MYFVDGCLSHKTAVAAACLSQFLRFLIIPGSAEYQQYTSMFGVNQLTRKDSHVRWGDDAKGAADIVMHQQLQRQNTAYVNDEGNEQNDEDDVAGAAGNVALGGVLRDGQLQAAHLEAMRNEREERETEMRRSRNMNQRKEELIYRQEVEDNEAEERVLLRGGQLQRAQDLEDEGDEDDDEEEVDDDAPHYYDNDNDGAHGPQHIDNQIIHNNNNKQLENNADIPIPIDKRQNDRQRIQMPDDREYKQYIDDDQDMIEDDGDEDDNDEDKDDILKARFFHKAGLDSKDDDFIANKEKEEDQSQQHNKLIKEVNDDGYNYYDDQHQVPAGAPAGAPADEKSHAPPAAAAGLGIAPSGSSVSDGESGALSGYIVLLVLMLGVLFLMFRFIRKRRVLIRYRYR